MLVGTCNTRAYLRCYHAISQSQYAWNQEKTAATTQQDSHETVQRVASRGKFLKKNLKKNKMKKRIVFLGVIVVMAVAGFAYTSSLRSEPALQRRRMDQQHHVPNADDDRYTRVVHHTYLYNIYSISNVPANNPKCIRHTHLLFTLLTGLVRTAQRNGLQSSTLMTQLRKDP